MLKLGILRLHEWTMNFNPMVQKASKVQVWVGLYGQNWVFWHQHMLSDIAQVIVNPLKFDRTTMQGDFGHYAIIFMDMDLAMALPNFVYLEVDVLDHEIEVHYENLPMFCSACKNIGHSLSICHL